MFWINVCLRKIEKQTGLSFLSSTFVCRERPWLTTLFPAANQARGGKYASYISEMTCHVSSIHYLLCVLLWYEIDSVERRNRTDGGNWYGSHFYLLLSIIYSVLHRLALHVVQVIAKCPLACKLSTIIRPVSTSRPLSYRDYQGVLTRHVVLFLRRICYQKSVS